MNREKAEKLLAALIFDDLDDSSKAELNAYLQTDDELRELLADMRMTVKVTSDALQNGADPVLNKRRMKQLSRLAQQDQKSSTFFTFRSLAAAAAVLAVIALPALLMPSLQKAKRIPNNAVQDQTPPVEFTGGTTVAFSEDALQFKNSSERFYQPEGELYFNRTESSDGSDTLNGYTVRYDSGMKRGGRSSYGGGYVDEIGGGSFGYDSGSGQFASGIDISVAGLPQTEKIQKGWTINDNGIAADSAPDMSFSDIESKYYYAEDGISNEIVDAIRDARDGDVIENAQMKGPLGKTANTRQDQFARSNTSPMYELIEEDVKTRVVRPRPPVRQPVPAPMTARNRTGTVEESAISAKPPTLQESLPTQDFDDRLGGSKARTSGEMGDKLTGQDTTVQNVQDYQDTSGIADIETWEGMGGGMGIRTKSKHVSELDNVTPGSSLVTAGGETVSNTKTDFEIYQKSSNITSGYEPKKEPSPILGDLPLTGGLFRSKDQKSLADPEQLDDGKRLSNTRNNMQENGIQAGQDSRADEQIQKALSQKKEWERTVNNLEQRKIRDEVDKEELTLLNSSNRATIPSADEINYPRDWKDITEEREELSMEAPQEENSAILIDSDEPDLPMASRFKAVPVNPWVMTERDSLSTFALDVDTASYTLCRRYINGGFLPPAGAVRMEEFINYFNYQYPQQSDRTFRVHAEATASPFARAGNNLTLLKIGVKARTIGRDQYKPAHLIFIIDTSASMGKPDRLPLVQQALNLLVDSLSSADRITLITCSNQARLHLEAVPVSQRETIRLAINAIQSSGSTNLLAGLQLGYATARRAFSSKQINQVVLCSDGVANVGQTEAEAVLKAVAADRVQGINITCVGVGYGSYNDAFLESLANNGDGSYVFLDSTRQAKRVFVEQLAATLNTVAKDARIQVSFNPDRVRRYRLIGYENRDIEDKRFRDDTIDAGEVGSGQCSTALYELELTHSASTSQEELGTVYVRYRDVETGQMEEVSHHLKNTVIQRLNIESSPYFYLAAAASQFAEILRQSEHVQNNSLTDVLGIAERVSQTLPLNRDVHELTELIRKSEHLPRAQ